MITKRIIPCLDIKDGRVVKGTQFVSLQDAGCPIEQAKKYNASMADELVFLDISATNDSRKTMVEVVREVAKQVFIPLTVGGGISSVSDVDRLLKNGADKISINSAAVKTPQLITELAEKFGSQCVVVAIDVKREGANWRVYINGGHKQTDLLLQDWVKEAANLGAGEFLITSIDADGSKSGYDLELYQSIRHLKVPVIASGGAGTEQDFIDVFTKTAVSGALAASIFHYNQVGIAELKEQLYQRGVSVRR